MRLALVVLLLASACHALADEAAPQQITYAEPGGRALKLHLFLPAVCKRAGANKA
ncbi:MAG: hypothetical protein RL748_3680 [Pseudomonadota bacterium]|jgi:hypothetical protein